jgi:molybdate transport system substrate-binding protein
LVGAGRASFWFTGLLAALVCVAGCKREEAAAPSPAPVAAQKPALDERAETQLTVFAASSLRDAFTALSSTFKAAHPRAEVTFNFAGSQELRAQLEQGAAADVFASADTRHMEALVKASRVLAPVLFAHNEPVVIVARESASTVHALADLPGLERIVLGSPEVPIGRYAQQILDRASTSAALGADFRARVEAKVVSRELNVRQVLAKVSLGEAQAGIVYRSDAQSAKDAVATLTIPPELNVIADYPIAVVADAGHPALARAWLALVTSTDGQRALTEAGFRPASEARP